MENLILIRKASELYALADLIAEQEFISYDTETTGLAHTSEIIGFSLSFDVETGYYIVLSEWSVEQQKLIPTELKAMAADFVRKLVGKKLIMHNAIYDCILTRTNFNVELIDSVHTDTLLLGHLLNENRPNGLKELGVAIFDQDADKEQQEMKASVLQNGGVWSDARGGEKEMYKADSELMGRYGAKDAILTLKLFYHLVPELYEQNLDQFFYEDETMPLLRGPTYQLNSTGLKVDMDRLQTVKAELEAECIEAMAFIAKETAPLVSDKYPGTNKRNTFNPGSGNQLAWLLFIKLENDFHLLTDAGKELCAALNMRIPYGPKDKWAFIREVTDNKDRIWAEGGYDKVKKKKVGPKKVKDPWCYMSTDKATLSKFADKYKWVKKLLEFKKADKIFSTYVVGIQDKIQYGIIRPGFLQHGTTSGRYSSSKPNFQNLPRDDKRVKSFIVSRPGKVFVGADESQLEPRTFASQSGDETLLKCFKDGEDFYSVVGAPIYGKEGLSMFKEDKDSFAKKFPQLRDKSKVIALSTPYGRTAHFMAAQMNTTVEEAKDLIDKYFAKYPKVELMMLMAHQEAIKNGVVYSIFGRPRRIPEATKIPRVYGTTQHSELPYAARTLLNLAMNHKVQSSAASIVNRAAIRFCQECRTRGWDDVKIVLQVHDELVAECSTELAQDVALVLKDCMENTAKLPGVDLIAEPKIALNLAELK